MSTDDQKTTQQDETQNPETGKVTAEIQLRELSKTNKALSEKLNAIEKAQAEAEKAKLEEQGNFKALLEAEKAEKAKLEASIVQRDKQLEITKAMQKAGVNPEFGSLLNPDIFLNSTNLEETFASLKTTNPALFVQQPTTIGSVGVHATTSGTTTMSADKAVEILNSNNYDLIAKNQKEITQVLNQTQ